MEIGSLVSFTTTRTDDHEFEGGVVKFGVVVRKVQSTHYARTKQYCYHVYWLQTGHTDVYSWKEMISFQMHV